MYFRKYTQWKADELSLTGFVKNEADGTVALEVQGDEDALTQFEKWCHVGSPLAKVSSVVVREINPVQGESEFAIVH